MAPAGVYAHVAAVVAVVVDVVAAAATVATVVDAVVSVATGPAVAAFVVAAAAAVSAQGDSKERWNQAVVFLALAERLALCYSELWTVVAALLLTTLTR